MHNSAYPKNLTPTDIRPAFMTIKEWTKFTGISRSKTYELLNTGILQAKRVGGRTLIDVEQGIDWLNHCPPWGAGTNEGAQ